MTASTEELMDVIDSFYLAALPEYDHSSGYVYAQVERLFYERIRAHLREHQLAFDLVGGKIIPKEAEELHSEVVVPALTLLQDRWLFAEVERQYQDALEELSRGKWADAVTDANSAAEQTLRIILGFENGQLPDLLAEARRRDLFGDVQAKWLKKATDGLAALSEIRSEEGDAHKAGTADEATAWLAVHWAGALIVFLVMRSEAD